MSRTSYHYITLYFVQNKFVIKIHLRVEISVVSNCLQLVVLPLLFQLLAEVQVVPERSNDDDDEDDRQNDGECRREVEDDAEVLVAEVDGDDVSEKSDERRETGDEKQVRHDDARQLADDQSPVP